MNTLLPDHLQNIVDSLCKSGCQNVNVTIETLTCNGYVAETDGLSERERSQVLNELKNIMSVYDEKD